MSAPVGVAIHWHVFIFDFQPPILPVLPEATTFLRTDVSKWDGLAAAFETAFAKFHRLDFCALNAGIDDRDDIFASISRDPGRPPRKPNMLPFEVNLLGPYYGLKLAAHYMSLNPAPVPQGGKVVITGSVVSLYALPLLPQYSATKYGVLGLVRSMAPVAERVAIRVNCLCPVFVRTGLTPPGLLDAMPASATTPMATILRASDELVEFDKLAKEGRAKWVSEGRNGAAVEGNLDQLYYREEAKPEGGMGGMEDETIAEAWAKVYVERNKKFAAVGAS